MEERWITRSISICRELTILGFLAVLVQGGDQKPISLFYRHINCIPSLYHHGEKINSTFLPGGGHVENVTLQLNAFGRPFIVVLSLNKNLFSASYIEKIFHSQGSSVDSYNASRSPGNCFYHGNLRFQPESKVAISTCNGFTGYITDRRDTYHIEPWKGQIHRIYRDKDRRKLPLRCGTDGHDSRLHTHSEILRRHKRSIRAPYDSNKNTRYVELYLVNDYRTFERHGKNKNTIIQRSQDIANIVSSLYRQLNIYVALVGVEVWTAGDLISITTSADNTMENFLRYRKERINPIHHNDNAHLITGVFFAHGVVGKAIKGPICTHQFSGGVNMDYGGIVTHVATTVAHEMGHNFGMQHDNDTTCECRDDKCIMAATSGQISPRHWSSCSQSALAEAFDLGMDYCLQNVPNLIFDGPICGNGFKEDEEECDCGLPKDCTNRCCNPDTCQLYPQAECATGRCCDLDSCKPKEASRMCREPIGECDLGEFCNGTSEYCPSDVHVYDGRPCMNGQSYCYKGECKSHTKQCKLLWGDSGRVSDPVCFQQLNTHAKADGSCGYNLTTRRYQRCDKEDVMCGLLHCVHLNEKLMFWRDNLALEMTANFLTRGNRQYVCRSVMLDVGLDMHDPGFVPDGAKCEHDKICINQKCTTLAKLNVKPCPNDCYDHGRCNTNGNCHCDVGYAPPLCDRPGSGGSLDSGPASNEYATDENEDLLIALLVVFLLVIPFIIIIILAYINRQRLWRWWRSIPSVKDRFKKNPYTIKPPRATPKPTLPQPRRELPPPYPSEPMAKPFISAATNQNSRIWTPTSGGNRAPGRPAVGPRTASSQKPLMSVPVQKTEGPSSSGKNQKSNQIVTSGGVGNFSKSFTPSNKSVSEPDATNTPKSPKIVKRDSFRGTEISYPVLKSTTNRNSVVENLHVHVDIIGPEANKPSRTPSPSRPKTGPVRRSHSDRIVPHPNVSQLSSALKKSTSTKSPRHLEKADSVPNSTVQPTDEWEDDERIYSNEMDEDDLVSSINNTLGEDSIYRNVLNEVDLQPQETMPPALPSRALKYKDTKPPNQFSPNVSDPSPNKSSPVQSNKKLSSSQDTQVKAPKTISKPSPPGKSFNIETKTQPKSNTPSNTAQTARNSKMDINPQSKPADALTRSRPFNSVSSIPSRGAKPLGSKDVSPPSLPRKPLTKASSTAAPDKNPRSNAKTPAPKVANGSPVKKDLPKTVAPSNAKVSNLTAKFNQRLDRTASSVKEPKNEKDANLVKRSATVTGPKPLMSDKSKLGETKPKPSLAPKPKEQDRKPVPPKPDSTEVKRVRSFKI